LVGLSILKIVDFKEILMENDVSFMQMITLFAGNTRKDAEFYIKNCSVCRSETEYDYM